MERAHAKAPWGYCSTSMGLLDSNDADESKPSPDIVNAAIGRSGLRPGELLMLGDTPYDIEAARKAGVATVAVVCGGWDEASLQGAVAVYETRKDILSHYEGSPFDVAA